MKGAVELSVRPADMHRYQIIKNAVKEILLPLGFSESFPDSDADYCGSRYSIFSLREKRFMVEWDGEEDSGSLSHWQGEKYWVQLEPIIPESTEPEFSKALEAACIELKTYL